MAFAGVCVGSLVLVVLLGGKAVAKTITASATQQETFCKVLETHDKFLVDALNKNILTLAESMKDEAVYDRLKRFGLAPFLGEPGSLVRQDIESTARALNVTDLEAARYIATMVTSNHTG